MTGQHPPRYFGTDGIRGAVGTPPITADFVLLLAHAVGRVLRQSVERPVVLIGKDTRISGYMLESALESGFNSAGVDVVLLGPLPTPGVAYLTRAQRANLGVVISASHNDYQDNGIKFFSAQGTKLPDRWEHAIEKTLQTSPVWASSAELGKARRLDDAAGRYIEFCKSTFDHQRSLHGLKIVVDAANGAAWHIAPKVFHELGAEVISTGCAPDGLNINAQCGATHPQRLSALVQQTQAHFGIALDGDADRLVMVDEEASVFDGDQLLYLIVKDRIAQGENIQGVVGTQMTNMGIELALQKLGVQLVRAAVGDRYVLEELHKRGWILGGESSGHLLILDKHTTGDGLVSALQVLQACLHSRKSMKQMTQDAPLFPQTLLNIALQPGQAWEENTHFLELQKNMQEKLGHTGRILVRQSGTEPVLRIMVEAQSQATSRQYAQQLADTFKP